jgi:hypothetical protein
MIRFRSKFKHARVRSNRKPTGTVRSYQAASRRLLAQGIDPVTQSAHSRRVAIGTIRRSRLSSRCEDSVICHMLE